MAKKPKVLCVDDEPQVLEGLALNLRRRYEVLSATSGAAGLEVLRANKDIAVVLSDMRMPGMDGAAFLARAHDASPDAVRILLTGHADMNSAIHAVNEGQIFRFLTKPCPPEQLLKAIDAAAELNELKTAEKVLLQQTLYGAVETLTELLSLTNPSAFGRANRLRSLVKELATELEIEPHWQVELAAMLSQIGRITLPPATAAKLDSGHVLPAEEQKMVADLPAVTDRLLAHIPRIEQVRQILALAPTTKPLEGVDPVVRRGVEVLRVAMAFDPLVTRGDTPAVAIGTLRARQELYAGYVLDALEIARVARLQVTEVQELPVLRLTVGMVLMDDVRLTSGALFVPRGHQITQSFVERARNMLPGAVKEPIRVIVQKHREVSSS